MSEEKVKKKGYLWKQGGSYKSWKARYFVLKGNSLEYYKSEGDGSPKGTIDLTTGRGVRTREQCDLEWPDKAKPGRSFGVAVENRTFYLYGEDSATVKEWMSIIQETINKVGKPTNDCSGDAGSIQEAKLSQVVRSGAKKMAQVAANVGGSQETHSLKSGLKMMVENAQKLSKEQDGEILSSGGFDIRNISNVDTEDINDNTSESSVDEIYDELHLYDDIRVVSNSDKAATATVSNAPAPGVPIDEIEEIYDLPSTTLTSNIGQDQGTHTEQQDSQAQGIYEQIN